MKFDRQIATAQRLIANNGQTVQWRQSAPTVNAAAPWVPGDNTNTDTDVSICFVPVQSSVTRKFLAAISGTDITVGKLAGLMGNVEFEPSIKDVVIRDGVELAITSIDLLSPNGQKILYTIEFEG
jgi:hypothetical protein